MNSLPFSYIMTCLTNSIKTGMVPECTGKTGIMALTTYLRIPLSTSLEIYAGSFEQIVPSDYMNTFFNLELLNLSILSPFSLLIGAEMTLPKTSSENSSLDKIAASYGAG
jgi:hypothetical protein